MKQVYSHKQLLELRHECQNAEAKRFCFQRKTVSSPTSGALSAKLKTNVWASYPVTANHNYSKLPLGSKGRDRHRRQEGTHRIETMMALTSQPIGISELPAGSRIIKAAPGTPIPINAIRVSLDGKYNDENVVSHRETIRYREHDLRQDQYKYGFDEVFWEVPEMDAGVEMASSPSYSINSHLEVAASTALAGEKHTKYGYYAPYFEQYINKHQQGSEMMGFEDHSEEVRSVYDSESFAEDSSDSSNVQIQLPDLRI